MARLPQDLQRAMQRSLPTRSPRHGMVLGMHRLYLEDLRKRYENTNISELIYNGDILGLRYLIFTGIKIEGYDLSLAIILKNPEMIELLVESGVPTLEGGLIRAAQHGDIPLVDYLISHGAKELDRAMIKAAGSGHMALLLHLVKKGANLRAREDEALIKAAKWGRLEIVIYLVEAGAEFLRDAIIEAAKWNHLVVVNYLERQLH